MSWEIIRRRIRSFIFYDDAVELPVTASRGKMVEAPPRASYNGVPLTKYPARTATYANDPRRRETEELDTRRRLVAEDAIAQTVALQAATHALLSSSSASAQPVYEAPQPEPAYCSPEPRVDVSPACSPSYETPATPSYDTYSSPATAPSSYDYSPSPSPSPDYSSSSSSSFSSDSGSSW